MDVLRRNAHLVGAMLLVLPLWSVSEQTRHVYPRQALEQDLCASINTASGSANFSRWQSLGLCQDHCTELDNAFAIVQWQSCWCSNVAPGEDNTVDLDQCNAICPGYDDESCGRRPGNFGYIRLVRQPTSTYSSSTAQQTSTTPSAPPPPAVTETETVQNTVTLTPSSATSTSTESSVQSSEDAPMSTDPVATTVTEGDTVRTVFITPSVSPTDSASGADGTQESANQGQGNDDGGLETGAIVGIVVGVIVAVLAIAALLLWLFFRRRKQRKNEANEKYDEPVSSQRGSSAGMISRPPNPEMTVTVDGRSWESDPASEQRRSRLMAVDPRMDPRSMFMRNKSHESVNTLRDDHDYSRRVVDKPVLRATNPDPTNDD